MSIVHKGRTTFKTECRTHVGRIGSWEIELRELAKSKRGNVKVTQILRHKVITLQAKLAMPNKNLG